MKKQIAGLVLGAAGILTVQVAQAGSSTLSLGYAQSKVQNFKNMPGVNLQYRYEWDSALSVMASLSVLQNDVDSTTHWWGVTSQDHVKARYNSLLIGPAWRLNEAVSLYAAAGMSHSQMARDYVSSAGQAPIHYADTVNALAYGGGVLVNLSAHVTANLGYEGSQTRVQGQRRHVNGVNVGLGYRF
ncbi:Ail/Lom family outer membrane beta-barrel protein [Edwardsiella piscicida]|uniref:Ail/Lom family outer membrane beta-barrel protein n=1 Tax=Edwardsiella piscicida TaxID=1263550 RepID=UPI0010A61B5E|nr:Ail/Lom family outer membrane beta-barrel protein [Edwardsiella piscicida]